MDRQAFLLTRLSDGHFHSGQSLADELGISRAAVCKRIRALEKLGLDIYSVRGKGYRLSQPLELLNPENIRQFLSEEANQRLAGIEVFPILDSTNMHLARELEKGGIHGRAILAEFQESGRGRRGKSWTSSFASGVCLSLGWQFDSTPASLNALSLATGVIVCRCLRQMGAESAELKWPNDIVCNGKKLGGILIETRSESAGASDVILGFGLNIKLSSDDENVIDQPVTSMESVADTGISRNALVASVLNELTAMLSSYANLGFSTYLDEWRRYDALRGRNARLVLPLETLNGIVLGITESGMLQMDIGGEQRIFSSGEISVRAEP